MTTDDATAYNRIYRALAIDGRSRQRENAVLRAWVLFHAIAQASWADVTGLRTLHAFR